MRQMSLDVFIVGPLRESFETYTEQYTEYESTFLRARVRFRGQKEIGRPRGRIWRSKIELGSLSNRTVINDLSKRNPKMITDESIVG